MRFLKSKDKGSAPKTPSTPKQGDKSVKQRYAFESGDPRGETENDSDDFQDERNIDMDLLQARARSMETKQHKGGPTTRHENEDPEANKLFQDVPGYKESLRPEEPKERRTPYVYPPRRGSARPTRRVEGEDPAADQLLAGASKRQGSSNPEETLIPVPTAGEESPMIRIAPEMRSLGLSGRNRREGEDPAADALFGRSARR